MGVAEAYTLIFTVGGVGVVSKVVEDALYTTGKEGLAQYVNLGGFVIIAGVVVKIVNDFFSTLTITFL